MTRPTDAELRAVSWDAWRGLLLRDRARPEKRTAARDAGLLDALGLARTPKGQRYLARLRELAATISDDQAETHAVTPSGGEWLADPMGLGRELTPLGRAVLYVRDQEGE